MRIHIVGYPIYDDDGHQIGYAQKNVPFTPEEEAEADAQEAAETE